jgi:hypothetical protein
VETDRLSPDVATDNRSRLIALFRSDLVAFFESLPEPLTAEQVQRLTSVKIEPEKRAKTKQGELKE